MILDPNNNMTTNSAPVHGPSEHQDMQEPPSYDSAVATSSPYQTSKGHDVKVPPQTMPQPSKDFGPGPSPRASSMPATTMYNYVNPRTQERIVSLLPPDHPQMVCLQQGGHVPRTRFGLLGILAAIFWFPFGIGCCLLDRRVYCDRCGAMLDEGICG